MILAQIDVLGIVWSDDNLCLWCLGQLILLALRHGGKCLCRLMLLGEERVELDLGVWTII